MPLCLEKYSAGQRIWGTGMWGFEVNNFKMPCLPTGIYRNPGSLSYRQGLCLLCPSAPEKSCKRQQEDMASEKNSLHQPPSQHEQIYLTIM